MNTATEPIEGHTYSDCGMVRKLYRGTEVTVSRSSVSSDGSAGEGGV